MNITEYFINDAVEKQLRILVDDTVFTNENFRSEEMELTESLCSETPIRFGTCEASIFQICVLNNVMPLKGKTMEVSMVLKGDETVNFELGRYKVDSDKPTADRKYRKVTAYDAMYDVLNADVTEWYNRVLPKADSTLTLKEFRDSFFTHLGMEQEETVLANDTMTVRRTVDATKLSGKTVINAICEINGCFGHMGRSGKFCYVVLKEMIEGVYPSDTLYPSENLYPASPANTEYVSKNSYISAEYEDYLVQKIDKLQIRNEEDEVGCIYGEGNNCYVVQDNFLLYGMPDEEMLEAAANMYSVIRNIRYRPAHVEVKGNPVLEAGDGIRLSTTYEIVYTYIFQRTLKGIQALRDTYDAEGEEYQREKVNSVREEIVRLKGKTNKLTRTVEETKLELADLEANAYAEIKANAEQISLKVSKDNLISEINQTAEAVTIKAEKIDLVGLVNAQELVAKYATVDTLEVETAKLKNLIAQKATIEQLEATNAKIEGKLEASEFTADKISAMSITVKGENVTAGIDAGKITTGMISADRIDADTIVGKLVGQYVGVARINCGDFVFRSSDVSWKEKTVVTNAGTETIYYLGRG